MENPLMLLIGCDCDPDRPRYGGIPYDQHKTPHKWRGITEGIRQLQEKIEVLERELEVKPKVIFCVRSDLQMKEIYGTAGWMLEEFRSLWDELQEQGHEIAWHPHLWRWSGESGCWYQEVNDAQWITDCLQNGFLDFTQKWGKEPFTCHMGWTFHSNLSMQTISALGVEMDFSASPGIFFEGGPGAGTTFDNKIDWRGAPLSWYRPSAEDYRRSAKTGEMQLNIVEIPKYTSRGGLVKIAKSLSAKRKKGTASRSPDAAFLQITLLPLLYGRLVAERLNDRRAEPFFATYFHPDELLEEKPLSAGTFLYSKNHLQKNLTDIVEKARDRRREIHFATGPEAVNYVNAL